MEKNGEIFVSESTRRTVFDAIRLDINNGRIQDIDRAIDIFRERIEGRYLNPIRQLNKDPFKNGFASMALCCLLIDTFYQFENGLKKTMENKKCYPSFLWDNLRDIFGTKKELKDFIRILDVEYFIRLKHIMEEGYLVIKVRSLFRLKVDMMCQ